jgi:hypothetical protein
MIIVFYAAYGIVSVLMFRPLAGHFAWAWKNSYDKKPDGITWFVAGMAGMTVAFAWPIFLLLWAGILVSNRTMPKVGAERKAEQKARERYIRDLERELEIR